MTVVTFALPQESRDFRAALRARGGRFGAEEIRVVHLGIGPAAAGEAMRRLLAEVKPRMLVCAGFAGGLEPRLRVGDLVLGENFTSPEMLACVPGGAAVGALVTRSAPIETIEAKAALARESGALAVDMETAVVAEACRVAGVPLLAVRAISDAADTALPMPFEEWFDLASQGPRRWRLLKYLACHPGQIRLFAQFVRGLAPARRALTDFLVRFLEQSS